jgi:c-di-GMP-binding flagellar brake protein YcgR
VSGSPESSTPVKEPLDTVSDPAQIANLLKRMKEHRALLTVTVPGDTDVYLSAVLDVDPSEGFCRLDELVPPEGNSALARAGRFNAYAQCQGIDISFHGTVHQTGEDADGLFYRIALPAQVHYRQRRAYYRARINRGQTIPIILPAKDGSELHGRLHDISVGGLGGEFENYTGPLLDPGETVADCRLLLVERPLNLTLEVRFASLDETRRLLRLGARFLDLPRPEQKLVEQFVAAVDREWRRRRRREE